MLQSRGHNVACFDLVESTQTRTHVVDLQEFDALTYAFDKAGIGAGDVVIHLAAIPSPRMALSQIVITNNVVTTFNICQAAFQRRCRCVMVSSSEAVLGFSYPTSQIAPLFVPIDESHPLLANDAYGISKILSEEISAAFSRRAPALSVICLRFAWIWWPDQYQVNFKRIQNDTDYAASKLWSYVDARDAAEAFRAALEHSRPGFTCTYIAAPTTFMSKPTHELLQRRFPTIKAGLSKIEGCCSVINCNRAAELFGFLAKYSVS